jgi:hypothetical protein
MSFPKLRQLLHATWNSHCTRTIQTSVAFGIFNGVCNKLKSMHVCDLFGIHLANRARTAAHVKQDGVVWGLLHVESGKKMLGGVFTQLPPAVYVALTSRTSSKPASSPIFRNSTSAHGTLD